MDYFQTHRHLMDYATFRRKGWPIGSGVTESAVKQFNKRVKGTEQFWSVPAVETILSLRTLSRLAGIARRTVGTVLEHPTGLFQGRLICHGPVGGLLLPRRNPLPNQNLQP